MFNKLYTINYIYINNRNYIKYISTLTKPTHPFSITASILSFLFQVPNCSAKESNPWNTLTNFGNFCRVYNVNLKCDKSIVESTLMIKPTNKADIDSKAYENIEWIKADNNEISTIINNKAYHFKYNIINNNTSFKLSDIDNNEFTYSLIPFTPKNPAFEPSNELKSKMTGQITELTCKVGSIVNKDDVIGYLESMKMKDALLAPKTGKISKILHGDGEIVEGGDVILIIN